MRGRLPANRKMSLWPMPGGVGHYVSNLQRLTAGIGSTHSVTLAQQWVAANFDSIATDSVVAGTIELGLDLGLFNRRHRQFCLTTAGEAFEETGDARIVLSLLLTRISVVFEIIEILEQDPLRMGLLHAEIVHQGLASWQTDKQIRYRLRWLEEVGVAQREGRARPQYSLTPKAPGLVAHALEAKWT